MRRSIGWFAVLALVGALAACGEATEAGATFGAAVETATRTGLTVATPSTIDGADAGTDGATTTTIASEASVTPSVATVVASSSETRLTEVGAETPEAEQVAGLLWMREEEKLARDVYQALSEMWVLPIFANIASSEQTHTDAVGELLELYGIPDPMADDVSGVFDDPNIQALYDDLVEQGSQSLVDALIVGATIEDMDIVDLQLRRTGIATIDDVYANLEKGSRNHLRAFIRTLERQGGEYTPSSLSVAEYEAIISSPTERGRAGA